MMLDALLTVATTTDVPAVPTPWDMFSSEFLGTAIMMTIGTAVTAAVFLPRSKASNSGWVVVTLGWGFAVFAGCYGAWKTGAHLNPSVTVAKVVAHGFDGSVTLNGLPVGQGGIPVSAGNVGIYLAAQFLGAFVGAVLAWLALKRQYDQPTEPGVKLGTFATGPAVRSYGWNFVTEVVATGILVAWVLVSGGTPTQIGPLAVALVIVTIGMGLGGATGYALNPARDLSPRIAYTILPIPGKTPADWSYSWIPITAPIVGSSLATVAVYALGMAA
jgi:glycerol uptake facilitator protein